MTSFGPAEKMRDAAARVLCDEALRHAEAATEIEREIAPMDYNEESFLHRQVEEALYTAAAAIRRLTPPQAEAAAPASPAPADTGGKEEREAVLLWLRWLARGYSEAAEIELKGGDKEGARRQASKATALFSAHDNIERGDHLPRPDKENGGEDG